jgi:hypothetical protein
MRPLDEIRAGADTATPGPVEVYNPNEGPDYGPLWSAANDAYHNPSGDDELSPAIGFVIDCGTREDAEFYANARTDVPDLLDLVESQASEIERLRAQVDAMGHRLATRYGYGGII